MLHSIIPQLKVLPLVENVQQQSENVLIIPKKYPKGYKEEKCQEPCTATFLLTCSGEYGETRLTIVGSTEDYNSRLLGYKNPQTFTRFRDGKVFTIGDKIEIGSDEFISLVANAIKYLYGMSFMK
ncbi:hypothetical protein UFOVP755_34 [uncultured Caudovirales phage]|jgi:hypothetical protein|uniref:Uncharacterized protein n=1 Tax=uncultured Caudovirales phage TaxID=2100421 RepID=A0A6J7X5X8_9CAUD|nr:hypothetical protein UFOVP755_34 [uncultured Caudovirales phage]